MRHYHAFGLRIASEVELPELHPGRGPADVEVRFEVAPEPSMGPPLQSVRIEAGNADFRLDGIHFAVRDGRSIDIVAPPSTPDVDVRIWLLGTVMAALLHQRSYLTIHANVIALAGGRAVAFAGASGAGKSSIAGWMESRGHRVLADDLCAIRFGDDGRPQLFEGIPRLKLWGDTLDALGRRVDGLQKVATGLDKYHVPLGRAAEEGSLEPLALERIYLLDRAAEGAPLQIEPLTGVAAAEGVLANAFRWQLGQLIQRAPRTQFDQCLAVARHAAVFRVARRWGMQWFDADAGEIERHLGGALEQRLG